MERSLRRESSVDLRVWTTPDAPSGAIVTPELTVEYGRQLGHPSSYGLLGGRRATEAAISVLEDGDRYLGALPMPGTDEVRWGLPQEYRRPVVEGLGSAQGPVEVTLAAHGLIGSSEWVFAGLTRLLTSMLLSGVPDGDEELWALREQAFG